MMQGASRGGEAGGDEHGAMIHPGFLQDRRVDEHDVGHGEKGGEAGTELGCHARAGGGEAEKPVERALCP